eukprot:TCONS_00004713-protein
MANSTLESFEKSTQEKGDEFLFAKVFIALEIMTLVLHAILQWVIFKLNVNENHYHLIRVLSIFDSIHATFVICQAFYFMGVALDKSLPNQTVMVLMTMSVYIFHASSMLITVLIATDRWIAVKYPLRYQEIVSKLRINIAVSISGIFCAVSLSCLFFTLDIRRVLTLFINRGIFSFLFILRTVTCVAILVLGKLTIRLRDESEANRPHTENLHGVEAERLEVIIKLKRSVKDVMKLNIWTCVFLLPMMFCSLSFLVTDGSELGIRLDAFFGLVNVISNPIVYLTSFSKIRQYWYRKFFQRWTIHPERDE